ncbi:MAG TPA: FlgD immunoglobulin-like domain containing protein [Acidobacteriota bacterium]|nr:FlgD immunoglobulin-like domain containing protein [Acidobacteriota bacterium]
MKVPAVLLFALLALGSVGQAHGFDRVAVHSARMQGLDLGERAGSNVRTSGTSPVAAAFSDILLSQYQGPARFDQENPCLRELIDGGRLIAWEDTRWGARKIFYQLFDADANRSGGNQFTAGSAMGTDYVEPSLAVDTSGRIYLFYRDKTRGLVFGSRYLPDLTVDLPEFLVNDTSSGSFAGPFALAVFPDGRTVVVWENYDATGSNIGVRIYNTGGVSVFGPGRVNSDVSIAQLWVPSVAAEPSTGFLVAWEDYRSGNADIYARLFDGDGDAVGDDFAVIEPIAGATDQFAPQMVYSAVDGYVIGWIDRREGQEVFIQQWDSNSGRVGENRRISLGDTLVSNWDLDLAASDEGKILASWAAFGAANSILAVRFDSGMVPGGPAQVHNLSEYGGRWGPSGDYGQGGRYSLTWTEFEDDDPDIDFMVFNDSAEQTFDPEIRVNLDSSGAPSLAPSVAASTDWYDLFVWVDERYDAGDVYLQTLSAAGVRLYGNLRVNQDTGMSLQAEPAIAVSETQSLVVWTDSRPLAGIAGQRIFGRYATPLGEFEGDEFLVSDTGQAAVKGVVKAVMASSGQALAVWTDRRDTVPQVWGRWLTPSGTLDGDEFQISDPVTDRKNADLHTGVDALGQFYVVWLDRGGTDPAVKGKWYETGKAEGGAFTWMSSVPGVTIDDIAVDVNQAGEIILFWSGAAGGVREIYSTRLSSSGAVLTPPLEVTDHPDADATQPAVSVDENGYVGAAWVDRRNGARQVYYQILDNSFLPVGVNEPVSSVIPEFMESPATDAHRGRAWFAWADPRANGLNVYASSVVYLPTDVEDETEDVLPAAFGLHQNYPNPFNPATTIEFSVPVSSELTLTVYNLLGRRVKILAQGRYSTGTHRILWDGTDDSGDPVASGVYLYRLGSDEFSEQRKMLLLK